MSSIRFYSVPIPSPLQGDVECIRIADYSGDECVAINVLPSGMPGIVFQHINGQPAIENITTASKITNAIQTLFLYGPGLEPSVMNYKAGSYVTIQILLKSHALNSLLGLNASILANDAIALSELSMESLNEQLLEANDPQKQVLLLTDFLIKRLDQMNTRDRLVEEGLQLIHKNIASVSVSSLTESLHLSERQFERRFRQTVGISAKSYIRVKRFNEAVRLMKSGRYAKLTKIAHDLHFHDQSHFIRDVKAFSGFAPKKLAQKTDDFHRTQTVYSYE